MQTNKIEVSKAGEGKTVYIPLSVYKTPNGQLTISCADPIHQFRFGTSTSQLESFKAKLSEIFEALVRTAD